MKKIINITKRSGTGLTKWRHVVKERGGKWRGRRGRGQEEGVNSEKEMKGMEEGDGGRR